MTDSGRPHAKAQESTRRRVFHEVAHVLFLVVLVLHIVGVGSFEGTVVLLLTLLSVQVANR